MYENEEDYNLQGPHNPPNPASKQGSLWGIMSDIQRELINLPSATNN